MTELVTLRPIEDGITQLSLNRPPVNALNPEFLSALESTLNELEKDHGVRTIIIGSDLTVFSAGMDLKEAQAFTISDQTAVVDGLNRTYAKLYGLSKPVIAAVNGAAIAGGLFFVLAADYSVACEHAKFGLTEVRVGVNFPVVPLEIARATLSPIVFRRLLLGGKNVSAKGAKTMGIIDEISVADDLIDRAVSIAHDYAAIPAEAYARVKAQMRAPALSRMNNALTEGTDPTREGWFTDETRPAMAGMLAAATRRS